MQLQYHLPGKLCRGWVVTLGHLVANGCSQVHKALAALPSLLLPQVKLAHGLYFVVICLSCSCSG